MTQNTKRPYKEKYTKKLQQQKKVVEFKTKIKDEKLGDVAQAILQKLGDATTKKTHNKTNTTIMVMHNSLNISQI
jgi:hypothetical protein